jgi:hypothetical protein
MSFDLFSWVFFHFKGCSSKIKLLFDDLFVYLKKLIKTQ